MTLQIIKLLALLAIFAAFVLAVQFLIDLQLTRRAQRHIVNERLKLLQQGVPREHVAGLIRVDHVIPRLARNTPLERFYHTVGQAGVHFSPNLIAVGLAAVSAVVFAIVLLLARSMQQDLTLGVVLLILTFTICVGVGIPMIVMSRMALRRRRAMEEQFPDAIDIFTRSLRAGHPVSAAIDLLTKEMADPLGSEFGIVSDEVAYGSELNASLQKMAERWDLPDLRMFAVCLSVQSETGGNLAEILSNLASVIRDRASLYLKVRALSSEGRASAWMLSIFPIATFITLFSMNPRFYLDVAADPIFINGLCIVLGLYVVGVMWIRRMVDLKV